MKKKFIVVFLLGLKLLGFSYLKNHNKINILNFKEEKFSLGYYIANNLFTFNVKPNIKSLNDNVAFVPMVISKFGFSIGLINNFNFNNYIDLRVEPSIHVTQRILNFRHLLNYLNMKYINNCSNLNIISSDIQSQINSIYLDFPFFIKLNGDLYHNYRPYIMSGFSCIFNLTPYNNFIKNHNVSSIFKFKTINATLQSEIGIEFFVNTIKLVPSFRSIVFLNNELINNKLNLEKSNYVFNFLNNLKSISSHIWMISIKFE